MKVMQYVLFYSNRCEHSRKVLSALTRMPASEETSFVCIDSRVTRGKDVFAVLTSGKEVPLPSSLASVPALLLLDKGNALVVGDQVMQHLARSAPQAVSYDPAAFSMSEMSGLSDGYAYLDVSAEEMLAQGGGGERIMHSFAGLQSEHSITTPQQVDDSVPKVGSVSMEAVLAQRATEVPPQVVRE
jgi:hypothetical protein